MITRPKIHRSSALLLVAFLCFTSHEAQAASVAVLAPVVEVKGSASVAGRGSARSGTLRAGASLAEGSTITTGADGRVLFAPVPGIAVSVAKETSVSLLRLTVTKSGGITQKRDAVLRLDPGTLSFSLEKRDASTTTFAVQTAFGTMNTRGSVGTITVAPPCVKVASLSGRITFTPIAATVAQTFISNEHAESSASVVSNASATVTRMPIAIEAGWFMAVCGKGDDAQIRIINTIARTWTSFSADGTQLATRGATAQELESTRAFFEATLAHATLAAGYGLLSSEGAAGIATTLTNINQSFAAVGLAPVEAPAVGSRPRKGNSFGAAGTPGSAGFSGGSANPANTSGEVSSREQ